MGETSAGYEVSKLPLSSITVDPGTSHDGDDDDVRGFYEVAIPYLSKMRFLDEEYCIRRDGNTLIVGNSGVIADGRAISL